MSLKVISGELTPFRRVLRNVGWLLTGKGVGAVLSLGYLALATRGLGVEHFGQFMLVLSTAQAVAALMSFQSWQIVVRYGMAPLKQGDRGKLARLVRLCTLFDLGAGAIGCGVAAAAILALGPRFGWSDALSEHATVFSVVLLLTIRSTAVGILRLHDRFAVGAMADAVTPIVRFVGAITAVSAGASVRGFLIAWAVAEVATAIVYWACAQRVAPGLLGWRAGRGRVPGEFAGLAHFAFVTNVNATLSAASKQFMVLVVGLVAGAAAAGAYRLAFQLSQSLARVSDMFSRGVFPEFTRAHAGEAGGDLQRLFRQSTRLTVGIGAAICVVAPLAGLPVLRIVGGGAYVDAYPVLLLLSFAAALDVMGVGFEPVLLGTGRAGAAFRIRLLSIAALALSAVLLVPHLGALGAAAATLVASAAGLFAFGRSAYRVTRRLA